MEWLECVERKSALAGEDVRFSLSKRVGQEQGDFDWDFNCDGLITISDIWEGIKWLVHIPGDALVMGAASPEILRFFEVEGTPYGTLFSTLLGWPIAIIIVLIILDIGSFIVGVTDFIEAIIDEIRGIFR